MLAWFWACNGLELAFHDMMGPRPLFASCDEGVSFLGGCHHHGQVRVTMEAVGGRVNASFAPP